MARTALSGAYMLSLIGKLIEASELEQDNVGALLPCNPRSRLSVVARNGFVPIMCEEYGERISKIAVVLNNENRFARDCVWHGDGVR